MDSTREFFSSHRSEVSSRGEKCNILLTSQISLKEDSIKRGQKIHGFAQRSFHDFFAFIIFCDSRGGAPLTGGAW